MRYLLLFLVLPLMANDYDYRGDFHFGVDALWWTPINCAWDFAQDEDVTAVKGHFEWGFRITGGYLNDCFLVNANYLYLRTHDAAQAENVTLLASQFTSKAVARIKNQYQTVGVRAGRYLHRKHGTEFAIFGALRWSELEQRRRITASLSTNQKAETWGVGLGVGLAASASLYQQLRVSGDLELDALVGERRTPKFAADTVVLNYGATTMLIPTASFRIGFDYRWPCRCLLFIVNLSYEMHYYWSALEVLVSPFDAQTHFNRDCLDLGFGGPSLGLSIQY